MAWENENDSVVLRDPLSHLETQRVLEVFEEIDCTAVYAGPRQDLRTLPSMDQRDRAQEFAQPFCL
jgi:hypothetical protein